jgi:hypothetical protein
MNLSEEYLAKVSRRPFEPGILIALALGTFLALALRLSLFNFEIENNQVTAYKVNLAITFVLEEGEPPASAG